jgi:hypothetical protein
MAPVQGLGPLSAEAKIVFRIWHSKIALALPANRRRNPGKSLQKTEMRQFRGSAAGRQSRAA